MRRLSIFVLAAFVLLGAAAFPVGAQTYGCKDCAYYEGMALCVWTSGYGWIRCETIYTCYEGICWEYCDFDNPCFLV